MTALQPIPTIASVSARQVKMLRTAMGPAIAAALEDPEWQELLSKTAFYKVGHHGSHNATLKRHGLEMMTSADLTAMIPVDTAKAKSKTSKTNPNGWEMPEKQLFERLKERTRGRVILADEKDSAGLEARCQDKKFLKSVEFLGEFVRDESVSVEKEPLCVQLTVEG